MTGGKRARVSLFMLALAALLSAPYAHAATKAELNRDSSRMLKSLYKQNNLANVLKSKARAVLVFPSIVKAGFMFGGAIGEGVLYRNGKPVGYYNSVAASYGLQAGVQKYGYAIFFMNEDAIAYLDKTEGLEIGVGPSIVLVDEGMGKSTTSNTLTQDAYAFVFDQKGLMAGLGLQGSKITKIEK